MVHVKGMALYCVALQRCQSRWTPNRSVRCDLHCPPSHVLKSLRHKSYKVTMYVHVFTHSRYSRHSVVVVWQLRSLRHFGQWTHDLFRPQRHHGQPLPRRTPQKPRRETRWPLVRKTATNDIIVVTLHIKCDAWVGSGNTGWAVLPHQCPPSAFEVTARDAKSPTRIQAPRRKDRWNAVSHRLTLEAVVPRRSGSVASYVEAFSLMDYPFRRLRGCFRSLGSHDAAVGEPVGSLLPTAFGWLLAWPRIFNGYRLSQKLEAIR